MQVNIYVVNLPGDMERLSWFHNEMRTKCLGMRYEVINAVVGKDIPDDEYHKLVDVGRARALLGRELGRGEAGLVLSHHKIFKKMIKDGVDLAIVFEDDAKLGSKLKELYPDIIAWCRKQSKPFALLLSEAYVIRKWWGTKLGRTGYRICKPISIYGTYGFVINASAAKAILEYTTPVFSQADDWKTYQKYKGIGLYSIVPFLVGNNDFDRNKSSLAIERQKLYEESKLESNRPCCLIWFATVIINILKRMYYILTGVTIIQTRSNNGLD